MLWIKLRKRMTHFLKHTSCIKCGSSDANGIYSDGSSYCFSCQGFKSSRISPYVSQQLCNEQVSKSDGTIIALPQDATTDYSVSAVDWFSQYQISVATAKKRGLVYSAQRNQLIFTFYDESKNLLAWQARNLSAISKGRRYFTQGDVNELLPIYHSAVPTRELVIVEDCLSAIKLAGLGRCAMPLLGSGISHKRLARLRPFYDLLDVFLDGDMWPKAQSIAKQAQMIGFKTRAVYSHSDPKELSEQQLKELLQ
jgi:hypothetical protein